MSISKRVILVIGLLAGSSAHSDSAGDSLVNLPVCFINHANNSEVILLGTRHLIPVGNRQRMLENLVDRSTLVLFENKSIYPKDGVIRKPVVLSKNDNPSVRLDSFVDTNDISELSRIFGTPALPESEVPLTLASTFTTAIFAKSIPTARHSDVFVINPLKKSSDTVTIETAAYAYALRKEKPIHDMESLREMFGATELTSIKREVSAAIKCTKQAACLNEFIENSASVVTHSSDGTMRYDELYHLAMKIPDPLRVTLAPRNQRMFKKIMSELSNGSSALVIVGAAHVGGPEGLSAKLEAAKFVKVRCTLEARTTNDVAHPTAEISGKP